MTRIRMIIRYLTALISGTGTLMRNPLSEYDYVDKLVSEGLARAGKNGKQFHVYRDGSRPYTKSYHEVGPFCEGLSAVRDYKKHFHIRRDGSRAYPESYDWVSDFNGGLAQAEKNGEDFYIRTDGSRVR